MDSLAGYPKLSVEANRCQNQKTATLNILNAVRACVRHHIMLQILLGYLIQYSAAQSNHKKIKYYHFQDKSVAILYIPQGSPVTESRTRGWKFRGNKIFESSEGAGARIPVMNQKHQPHPSKIPLEGVWLADEYTSCSTSPSGHVVGSFQFSR